MSIYLGTEQSLRTRSTTYLTKFHCRSYCMDILSVELEGCPRTTCRVLVTLNFDLPKCMFQMAHLHVMEDNCVKIFWNPTTIVNAMVRTNSDGRRDAHTPNYYCINCLAHRNWARQKWILLFRISYNNNCRNWAKLLCSILLGILLFLALLVFCTKFWSSWMQSVKIYLLEKGCVPRENSKIHGRDVRTKRVLVRPNGRYMYIDQVFNFSSANAFYFVRPRTLSFDERVYE